MPGRNNIPKGFDKSNYTFKGFPTKDNCDLSDPRQKFLWALVALPGQRGAQLVMPVSYLMLVSEHLHEVGAMLECDHCGYSKQAEKVYVPPQANDPHWLTSPGYWVDADNAPQDTEDALDAALDSMPAIQKAALFQRLKKRHEEGEL